MLDEGVAGTMSAGMEFEPGATGLRPVELQRSTLAETLVTRLREQILSGRLAPGTPLPTEHDIGLAFGVGRTTVREALRGLLAAGFVERQAKKLIVKDPSLVPAREVDDGAVAARASIQEIFHTRKLLEVEGARLAATNRDAEDLAALRAILDQMDPRQPERYHSLDMDFHTRIMTASGNPILAQVYQSTRQLFFKRPAFWRVFGPSPSPEQRPLLVGGGRKGHQALLEAIAAGDPDEAARVALEHLSGVEQALVERVRNHESQLASA